MSACGKKTSGPLGLGVSRREGWREREGADEVRAFGAAIEAAERALGRRK